MLRYVRDTYISMVVVVSLDGRAVSFVVIMLIS